MNDFKVNDYTTITDFKRTGVFEMVMKHGYEQEYEQFTGLLEGDKIKGLICLTDNNIYKLTSNEADINW